MTVEVYNIEFEKEPVPGTKIILLIDDPAPGTIKDPTAFNDYVGDMVFEKLRFHFGENVKSFEIKSIY